MKESCGKLAFIRVAFGKRQGTLTMSFIVLPLPDVHLTVVECIGTLAMPLSVHDITSIDVAIPIGHAAWLSSQGTLQGNRADEQQQKKQA
jgi:hypothetical protein